MDETQEQPPAVVSQERGRKHDDGKRRWSLLPWDVVGEVVEVLEYGAGKYAPLNWQRVDNATLRYFDAAIRHLSAYAAGEKNDAESGKSHLAHAACCVLFLMWHERGGK